MVFFFFWLPPLYGLLDAPGGGEAAFKLAREALALLARERGSNLARLLRR